jgi:hypothetical protein
MDILGELKKWKCELEPATGGAVLLRCPFPEHEDKNASVRVQLEDSDDRKAGSYWCPVCRKSGDFYDLLGAITKTPKAVIKKQYTRKLRKISAKKVEAWYAHLNVPGFKTAASVKALRELKKRGLTDETAKKYSLGYDPEDKRITFPIMWGNRYVNVLKYGPGKDPKFYNYAKGYGNFPVLYPQDQLTYDKIVICGGPAKALVVAQEMNRYGYGAVSFLGEYCIPSELAAWLYGKKVWVCFDIDSTGERASDSSCGVLRSKVDWVGNLKLPLSKEVYPKGDVNDYFGEDEEFTAKDFLQLLEETKEWEAEVFEDTLEDAYEEVNIERLWGSRKAFNFSTTAYLSGIDDSTAHKIPKKVFVSCSGDSEYCSVCKLMRANGYDPGVGLNRQINPKDPACIGFVNISSKQRIGAFKEYLGIPEGCYKCEFKPSEELYTVRYILLSDTESDAEIPISATVITDGNDLCCGEVCAIKGRVDQSPVTCEEVRIITEHEPKDVLSEYVVTDEALLKTFQTEDDSYDALQAKIDDINYDLERNVTYIYDRPQVHTLFDLTFHSPLWIPYENALEPGWISCLLVSETAQGKSTIMRRLISHYGYGAYIDAANTSIAGLVGGIKSVGKRQFVKWGILPQMDKRLVCIEEYANAPVELLRAMRATRDSGYVVLNKIDKGRAKARTRTIIMSNPKKILKPGVIVDGVSLLEDLVERPEDLRRFDVGMWIPKIEIDQWHDAEDPKYSSRACHELITWAWTLQPENIRYTEEAVECIRSNGMKDIYPNLHLVGAREFDVKLARLSAAVAARTYNVAGECLQIEKRHVVWTCNFLKTLYDDPEFGYTNRVRREKSMDDKASEDQLINTLKLAGNPIVLCDFLMMYNRYSDGDLKAAIGDAFAYETIKNKLIILGCIVGEEDTKWNCNYLPTKRLRRHLTDLRQFFAKQYRIPSHIKESSNEGSNSI